MIRAHPRDVKDPFPQLTQASIGLPVWDGQGYGEVMPEGSHCVHDCEHSILFLRQKEVSFYGA